MSPGPRRLTHLMAGLVPQRDWLTMWSTHLTGGPVERTHPLGQAT